MSHPLSSLRTRRSFLRSAALGSAFTTALPRFLADTIDQLHAEAGAAQQAGLAHNTGRDHPILVVLHLAGGNDGLNTLVPHGDDEYARARPKLRISPSEVRRFHDHYGWHPALDGFERLFDSGRMGIVHAVGYPSPNRSHFRSTEIWATASDSQRFELHGWLGRYFDHACSGIGPLSGIAVGRQAPQAFRGKSTQGLSIGQPMQDNKSGATSSARVNRRRLGNRLRGMQADDESMSAMAPNSMTDESPDTELVEDLSESGTDGTGFSGSSIGEAPAGTSLSASDPLAFLERTALDAQISNRQIQQSMSDGRNAVSYPSTPLGQKLQWIAQLISGNMPTRIFHINQGGYDTHIQQAGAHERLLKELGDALFAFQSDLDALGLADRVVVMTFSEFGRRVAENASGGTDHGAAAPLFLIGKPVRPGFHGPTPSLAPRDLVNGDIRFQTDFRSVYAGLLEHWLRTPSHPILGRTFDPMPLIT